MGTARINWTDPALQDLDGIFEYINRDAPAYAHSYVQRIFDAVDRLTEFPHSGRKVPEAGRTDVLEVLFEDYRIVYWLISGEQIDILGVIHGGRDLTSERNQPW